MLEWSRIWRIKTRKLGFLAHFPFGVFAYTRLDERLEKSPEWKSAVRQGDKDPMGQSKEQPHVEFFNTELYSGVPSYANYPFGKLKSCVSISQDQANWSPRRQTRL